MGYFLLFTHKKPSGIVYFCYNHYTNTIGEHMKVGRLNKKKKSFTPLVGVFIKTCGRIHRTTTTIYNYNSVQLINIKHSFMPLVHLCMFIHNIHGIHKIKCIRDDVYFSIILKCKMQTLRDIAYILI